MLTLLLGLAVMSQDMQPSLTYCVTQRNTIEMNLCGAARVKAERERMEQYLEASVRFLDVWDDGMDPAYELDLPATVRQSQAAWEAYAKAHCDTLLQQNIDGTVRTIIFLGCMEEMVFVRSRQLWTDFLQDSASGDLSLAEPTVWISDALIAKIDIPASMEVADD